MNAAALLSQFDSTIVLGGAVGLGYAVGWLQRWLTARRESRRQRDRWQSILRTAAAWRADVGSADWWCRDGGTASVGDEEEAAASTLATVPRECEDMSDFESELLEQIDRLIAYERRLQCELHSARTLLNDRSAELKLSHAEARRDPLSALLNRRGFDEVLDLFLHGRRNGRHFAVIMIDIDHFKRINDVHGHVIGDRVLSWIGKQLTEWVRPTDCVARFGGDEFAVLLREVSLGQAKAVASRLLQAFRDQPFVAEGDVDVPITLSIGLAAAGQRDTRDSLVCKADEALYQSKAQGRNRLTVVESPDADQRPLRGPRLAVAGSAYPSCD